jgi:hypothetical protein
MRTLFVLAALASAVPAHALSCAWGVNHVFPETDAADVPTNVVLRVGYLSATPEDQPLSLLTDAGEPVAATWTLVSAGEAGASVWALRPDAPLLPDTTYHLTEEGESDPGFRRSSFRTGAGPDLDPPGSPSVRSVRRDVGRGIWGSWHHHVISVEAEAEPQFFEVDVSDSPDFASFRTVQAPAFVNGAGDPELVVGNGVCGGELDLSRRDKFVRVRAIDLAGNMSGDSSDERARGCHTLSTPMGLAGGFALALAGLLGRRRPR